VHSIHSSFVRSGAALVASVLALVGLAPAPATHLQAAVSATDTTPPNASPGRAFDALAALPLSFEPRELGGAAAFVGRGHGYNISVGARGASVALLTEGRSAELAFAIDGATGTGRLEGQTRLPGVMHHYVGGPEAWHRGVATYARVLAHDVRPGIDVAYYGDQRQLEYDFIVKPGANPADAGMLIEGADRLEIDRATGDLLVHVAGQVVRQRAPIAYQEIGGVRRPVTSAFVVDTARGRVGFEVGSYDARHALVIDPVLVYSTWFGGESQEAIISMKVDANGFIYVLGVAQDKSGFPTTPGALQPQRAGTPTAGGLYPIDYFISKLNPAGSALVYSTLLGGSDNEATWSSGKPGALDVDAQGNVHIVGDTESPDYPVTGNAADGSYTADISAQADAVYTRLNADGSLGYSTYIGGIRREAATGVDVDATGTVYVVGKTASSPADGFITTVNAYRATRSGGDDIFVQRYSPAGVLEYSTYFGGTQGDMQFQADIVANGNGKATIGSDTSTDIQIVNGFQATRLGGTTDGFVAVLDTNAAGAAGLLYSTYLSGSSEDHVLALDLDPNGFLYVGGESRSNANFPVTAGAARQFNNPVGGGQEPWDGFVAKLDLTRTGAASRIYTTFTGGNDFDDLQDIAVDAQGRVHLVGSTRSEDLPMVGAVQTTLLQLPPYVQILNPTGTAFVFSSYLGSNTNGQLLYTIAVNAAGETYLGGTTNDAGVRTPQFPNRFPLVNPFQTAYGGGDGDAVLQKLGFNVDLSITKTANVTTLLPGQNVTFTLQVTNPSTDPASGVVISDNLPAGLEFVSCTAGAGGICSNVGNNVSISFAQLSPAGIASAQVVAKLTATTPGQQITNSATVTAGVLDPVPTNNTATANIGLPTLEPTGDADNDGLSNEFETRYGLDPFGGPGSGPGDDPDGDGKTNLQELAEGTHPRGFVITYLAEGATGAFFDTRLAVANPSALPALVLTRFQRADGFTIRDYRVLPPMSRTSIDVENIPGLEAAEFSTLIEADVQVVADRTMTWDQSGYGSHAERGILTRTATTWYFAEGATFFNFDLFYLIQNPNDQAAQVKVTYLLPAPAAPLVKHYVVGPRSRFNIWVDDEGRNDPALAALATAELSAIIESTNGVPIIAERAMYLNRPGQPLGAGHESAGVNAPATQWFLAEGATGNYFDLFILIANPQADLATVQADFLLANGEVITKTYQVPGNSRFNIWVDQADAALADAAVSTRITSTNGVPIIVERSMWWPGPTSDTWQEAHNSPGETTTGTRWAMAEGELGGAREVETYVLVANTSAFAGTIRATVLFEDGTAPISRDYAVSANSRFNIAPYANEFFPEARGKKFGMIVESTGGAPAQIVVERAMYSNANGVRWAAGTNALATKLQ
jgi:uncharacterized repeat protein (TIGR01451 family)